MNNVYIIQGTVKPIIGNFIPERVGLAHKCSKFAHISQTHCIPRIYTLQTILDKCLNLQIYYGIILRESRLTAVDCRKLGNIRQLSLFHWYPLATCILYTQHQLFHKSEKMLGKQRRGGACMEASWYSGSVLGDLPSRRETSSPAERRSVTVNWTPPPGDCSRSSRDRGI